MNIVVGLTGQLSTIPYVVISCANILTECVSEYGKFIITTIYVRGRHKSNLDKEIFQIQISENRKHFEREKTNRIIS